MSACSKTRDFLLNGNNETYAKVLGLYDQVLRLKAENKSSKPENVIKSDKWYQNELPKKIKSRGKDPHLTHDEIVQTIKWKLARGKFFPQLTNLVRINTPKAVQTETRKAFRKMPHLEQAVQGLTNLKGVGVTMASAILAAGAPHIAPFMADECLLAMPDCDSLDYTMKEYMRLVEQINITVARLNEQGGEWNPHSVEMAVWTYYIANDLKPELLTDLDSPSAAAPAAAAKEPAAPAAENGTNGAAPQDTEEDSNLSAPETAADNAADSAAAAAAEETKPEENGSSSQENGEAEEKKTNGENGQSTNGSAETTPASTEPATPSEEATETSTPTPAAEAAAEPKEPASAVPSALAEAETDTNDSTKENKEEQPAAAAVPAAQKRPVEEDAAAAEQPAEKKVKQDETTQEKPAAEV